MSPTSCKSTIFQLRKKEKKNQTPANCPGLREEVAWGRGLDVANTERGPHPVVKTVRAMLRCMQSSAKR